MTRRRLSSIRPLVPRLVLIAVGTGLAAMLMLVTLPAPSFAQAPWERAALNLETSFSQAASGCLSMNSPS